MTALSNTATHEPKEAVRVDPTLPAAAGDFGPADLLHGIRRRGLIAGVISAPIAVGVAIGVFLLQEPKYRASALLRLSSQENSLVFSGTEGTDFEIFQGTQKELVRTRMVMTAALRNLADSSVLQLDRPVEWMIENVSVSTPKKTEIMTVSAVASKQADPIGVVNAVVDAYMVEVVNRERDTRQRRLAGIEAVYSDKQDESRRKRNALKGLAEQLGTGDSETLSIKQQLLAQELGFLRRQRIQLQTDRWTTESKIRSLEAVQSDGEDLSEAELMPTVEEIDEAIARDSIYSELVRDKVMTFRMENEAESSFKNQVDSPFDEVQSQIEVEMDERRDQIKEELTALAPLRRQVQKNMRQQEVDRLLKQYSAQLSVLDQIMKQVGSDESKLMQEFKTVGNQSIDVELMRSEIDQLDTVLSSIAQQREELKVELQSRPRVEVLRKAEEIESADFIKRVGLSGFSGLLAFGVPIALLLLMDLSSSRVNSSESLSARTGLTILGTLPTIPNGVIRKMGSGNSKRSRAWKLRLEESVKRVSSLLSQPVSVDGEIASQVIMVTSAARGEGKTTLANHLATCLAHSARKVILCDFDLRRPKLHKVYQLDASPGVCDVLRGTVAVSEALRPADTTGLEVMTAGDCCPMAIQALVEEKVEPLFKELRDAADLVIVDAGAVLSSADVAYLCPHVDQIVFSARRDVSRVRDLQKALRMLQAGQAKISGAVVTEKCDGRFDATLT